MKKLLAILLALVLALCSCAFAEAVNPDDIEDTMTSADGEYEIAFVTDVGQHQMWAIQHFHFDFPGQLLTSGGFGTMGFGLGAAIGAQVAHPDTTVLHIAGDGCFRMNCHELATVSYYKLPIISVVFNNGTLGMVRQWQNLIYEKRFSATTLDRGPDFVKLAEAYGLKGFRVTNREEMEQAFMEALGAGCGTLGLLLCAKDSGCTVTGLEISETAHKAAVDNIAANSLHSRMESICADLKTIDRLVKPGSFSACVSNPPYFSGGPESVRKPAARREDHCTAEDLFAAAARSLKYGGDLFLVHRPERLGDLIGENHLKGLLKHIGHEVPVELTLAADLVSCLQLLSQFGATADVDLEAADGPQQELHIALHIAVVGLSHFGSAVDESLVDRNLTIVTLNSDGDGLLCILQVSGAPHTEGDESGIQLGSVLHFVVNA